MIVSTAQYRAAGGQTFRDFLQTFAQQYAYVRGSEEMALDMYLIEPMRRYRCSDIAVAHVHPPLHARPMPRCARWDGPCVPPSYARQCVTCGTLELESEHDGAAWAEQRQDDGWIAWVDDCEQRGKRRHAEDATRRVR